MFVVEGLPPTWTNKLIWPTKRQPTSIFQMESDGLKSQIDQKYQLDHV